MEKPLIRPKAEGYYAETVYDRIESHIDDTLKHIEEGEDILVEVPLQNGKTITATYFGFRDPNFIIVAGFDQEGNNISALLPHDSIQVVLTIIKSKNDERNVIGFQGRDQ